ncbi:MAG: hypothetical protein E6H50_06735 [Betaproteobacteria bacterium]|nr:MAG: hypothetical protein E6H50_06735 [Betaproteobacteria bacterium]
MRQAAPIRGGLLVRNRERSDCLRERGHDGRASRESALWSCKESNRAVKSARNLVSKLRVQSHAALERATAAASGRDVRLGGGVSTIRQYLRAALIDELHLAVRPVLLGSGEHLLNDIDMRTLGYECAKCVAGERATHVFLRKRV